MSNHWENKVINVPEASFYSYKTQAPMVQTNLVKGLRGEQYNFKNKTHIPENRYEHIQITPQTYV